MFKLLNIKVPSKNSKHSAEFILFIENITACYNELSHHFTFHLMKTYISYKEFEKRRVTHNQMKYVFLTFFRVILFPTDIYTSSSS